MKTILKMALLLALTACQKEPTIVIKFEPNDLSMRAVADAGNKMAPADAGNKAFDAGSKPAPRTDGGAACKTAKDCVAMKVDCCDCNNGGAQRVVGKVDAARLAKELTARCKGTMCPAMISNDPSCGKKADCVAGSCTLR